MRPAICNVNIHRDSHANHFPHTIILRHCSSDKNVYALSHSVANCLALSHRVVDFHAFPYRDVEHRRIPIGESHDNRINDANALRVRWRSLALFNPRGR